MRADQKRGPSGEIAFPLPPGGATLTTRGDTPGELTVGRFATAATVDLGALQPGRSAILRIPTDSSPTPVASLGHRAERSWRAARRHRARDRLTRLCGPRGVVTQPPIQLINRPTFQQAVEIGRQPASNPRLMAWVETESLSFTARHEGDDEDTAQRTLDSLEDLRLRLEDRFEQVPGEVTAIVHPTPAWLAAAHPFLPAARWAAAPAGRRYLAGWAMANEVHILSDEHADRRAAGEDSRRALRGTAERLYVQIVLGANNEQIPPPWGPRRFARYLRWAWLIEERPSTSPVRSRCSGPPS